MGRKVCAVVGFDRKHAEEVMSIAESDMLSVPGITVSKRINNMTQIETTFSDGTVLRWLPLIDAVCGCRFDSMYCNRWIDGDTLSRVVMPMYCGRVIEIVWVKEDEKR